MAPHRLEVATPGEREIVIARAFSAPRRLVWDRHTRPELVRRWLLGPPGWEMPVCKIDLRVGGKYRYEWESADRNQRMGLSGVFTEVTPLERLASKETFDDDWTGGETLVTQAFSETNDTTRLVVTVLYPSRQARDNAARSGMTDGMEAGYQRLDELLADGAKPA